MKKELLLVLGILEGRGLHPVEGHKLQIEAQLNSNKLSTEAFPLTNAPKFNTEISWEAEKQTIRRYKLNRIPIRIECFEIDEKKGRKSLGYIILPLTSAVEGVEVDSKWYKLLGGSNRVYKTPPSILLRLHLETMALDQQNQMNGNQINSFKNVQHIMEDNKLSYLLDKNQFLKTREGLEIRCIQTNGNARSGKYEENASSHPYPDPHILKGVSNGARVEEGELLEEEEEEEESDNMEDYESEDYSDDPNTSGIILNSFSLAHTECDDEMEASEAAEHLLKNQNLSDKNTNLENASKESRVGSNKDASVSEKLAASSAGTSITSRSFEKDPQHEKLLNARASTREQLKNLSQSLRATNLLKQSSTSHGSFSNSAEINASLEKRILETSSIFDRQPDKNIKTRKVNDSTDSKFQSNQTGKNDCNKVLDLFKSSLLENKASTSAFLLSQSIRESDDTNTSLSPRIKSSPPQKLIPYLNQEEGFFTFKPSEELELCEFFNYSVTIIYAKNLSTIVPPKKAETLKEGYQFCYSLLGYPIYTDSFYELDSPDFLAEKASSVIFATHDSMSRYFAHHYFLPIHFLSGETCLGLCTIDISQLIEIGNKNEAKVEGVFEVVPADDAPSHSDSSKPIIGVSFEVSKFKKDVIASSQSRKVFPSVESSSVLERRRERRSYNEVIVSDSMSSSDSDESTLSRRKVKARRIKCRSNCKTQPSKREKWLQNLSAERDIHKQKRELLHEAAYEIELWKEEQQSHFIKEWTEKEETLQRLIASEWSSKVKVIEGELSHRISECDKLQEKLNSALSKLALREEKIKSREAKVTQSEHDLQLEREKLLSEKNKGSKTEKGSHSSQTYLATQLETEKKRRNLLEKEVSSLREELLATEETVKTQNQEVISLRKKLIQSDDIIGISKDKETLERKIDSLQERKQYYKTQWLNAITDLHKLHSAHKRTIDELTADRTSPIRDLSLKGKLTPETISVGYKLRKLKDERKILMESGLYSSDHSVIKNIDKKIRELIG